MTGVAKNTNFGSTEETREFKELCKKLKIVQENEEELEKWNKLKEGPNSLKLLSTHKLIIKVGDEYVTKKRNLIPNYISDVKEIKERLRKLIPKQVRGD